MTIEEFELFKKEVTRRANQYIVTWNDLYEYCLVNGHEANDKYLIKKFEFAGEVEIISDPPGLLVSFDTDKFSGSQLVKFDLDHIHLAQRMLPNLKQLAALWQAINKSIKIR